MRDILAPFLTLLVEIIGQQPGRKGVDKLVQPSSSCRLLCHIIVFVMAVQGCGYPTPQPVNQQEKAPQKSMFSESEAYEQFMGRWSRQLAPAFAEFAGIEGVESVLDVGTGTGALAEALLAESQSCRVIGVDPALSYVEHARSRLADERVTFEKGDGQDLRFQNDSFDATLSLLVINFISEPRDALAEMIRVTRPAGIVAGCVWDYDQGMEMLRVFWDEAVALNPAASPRDERNMPFCTRDQLRDLWRDGGLLEVEVAPLVIETEFASFDDFWNPFLLGQGPAGAYVASLSDADRNSLKERIKTRLLPNDEMGSITLHARAWAVKGVVSNK